MKPHHGLPFGVGALIFATTALFSQFAIAQTPAPTSSSDEVITLSEFQVTAEDLDNTYIATEAIAGTRTGDKIINIPFSIQVFTEDFVNDFQLFNDDDLLGYVSAA